jgi:hypothetical protein
LQEHFQHFELPDGVPRAAADPVDFRKLDRGEGRSPQRAEHVLQAFGFRVDDVAEPQFLQGNGRDQQGNGFIPRQRDCRRYIWQIGL